MMLPAAVTVVPEHLVTRDVNPVFGTRCPCGIIWNMRSSGDLTHVFSPENTCWRAYVYFYTVLLICIVFLNVFIASVEVEGWSQ